MKVEPRQLHLVRSQLYAGLDLQPPIRDNECIILLMYCYCFECVLCALRLTLNNPTETQQTFIKPQYGRNSDSRYVSKMRFYFHVGTRAHRFYCS